MHKIEDVILKRKLYEQTPGVESKIYKDAEASKVAGEAARAWIDAENTMTQEEYASYIRVWQLSQGASFDDLAKALMALTQKAQDSSEGLTEAEQIEAKLIFIMVWEMAKPLVEALQNLALELAVWLDNFYRSLPLELQNHLSDVVAAKEARRSKLTGTLMDGIQAAPAVNVNDSHDPLLHAQIIQTRRRQAEIVRSRGRITY